MMSRICPKWLPRIVLLGLPALVLVLLGAADALAQNAAAPAADPASLLDRGPGSYLSWPKIAALWLVFLAWVHTTDWLSSDAQEMKQQYLRWNIITVASFLGALVLAVICPKLALPTAVLATAKKVWLVTLYHSARKFRCAPS